MIQIADNNQAISPQQQHRQKTQGPNLRRALWLMPIVFIIHDGEELFTMPGWIANHQEELNKIAGTSETAAEMISSLPKTTSHMAVAIGFILLLFVAVTAGASVSVKRGGGGGGFWLYAYSVLLGGLFLHVFTHLAQTILFGGQYTPGVVGAVLAVVPGVLYIYKRLFEEKLLTRKSAVLTAILGIALFVPAVLLAQGMWRIFDGGGD